MSFLDNNYALVRVGKIKASVSLGARSNKGMPAQQIEDCADHDLRLKPTPNADPEKWTQNRLLIVEDNVVRDLSFEQARGEGLLRRELFRDSVEQKLGAVGIDFGGLRKDAVLAQQVLFSASPSYFERANDREGALNKWWEATVEFAQKRFGRRLMLGVGHLDERTPHIGWLVIPILQKDIKRVGRGNKGVSTGITAWRLSAFDLFGPRQIETLWTEYADAMAPLGLERPPKGVRAHYTTIGEYYTAVEDAKAHATEFTSGICFRLDSVQKRLLGSESAEDYRKRNQILLDAYLAQLRDHVRRLHFQAVEAKLLREKESSLRHALQRNEDQLARATHEREVEALKNRTTAERLRSVAIADFIEKLSLPEQQLEGISFSKLADGRLLAVLPGDEFAVIADGDPSNVVDSGHGVIDLLMSILRVGRGKAIEVAMELWGPASAGSIFAWSSTHANEPDASSFEKFRRHVTPAPPNPQETSVAVERDEHIDAQLNSRLASKTVIDELG